MFLLLSKLHTAPAQRHKINQMSSLDQFRYRGAQVPIAHNPQKLSIRTVFEPEILFHRSKSTLLQLNMVVGVRQTPAHVRIHTLNQPENPVVLPSHAWRSGCRADWWTSG